MTSTPPPATRRLVAGALVVVSALLQLTCRLDDLLSSSGERAAVAITLTGEDDTVGVGETLEFTAETRVDGVSRSGYPLSWRTSDPAVATVDGQGLLRGVGRGSVLVTARLAAGAYPGEPVSASAPVQVIVHSLTLSPADTALSSLGDAFCLRAIARNADGDSVGTVAPDRFAITGDPDATIGLTPAGCVTARAAGAPATVVAEADTAQASAVVRIEQRAARLAISPDTARVRPGESVELGARAFDARDNLIDGAVVTWSSEKPGIAMVDGAGLVSAQAEGETWVRGEVDAARDSTRLLVDPNFSDPPSSPTSLAQFKTDGVTPILVGETTDEPGVQLSGTVQDPDGDDVRLEVEVVAGGAQFSATPTDSSTFVPNGQTATVSVTALADDTRYRWRARTKDAGGRMSGWVSFPQPTPNPEGSADFNVAVPQPPDATGPGQFRADGVTPISIGGSAGGDVVLKATVLDPDPGDVLTLEVEVRIVPLAGDNFTQTATGSASGLASGATGSVTFRPSVLDLTGYHWQLRACDQTGQCTAWAPFGGNAETQADFTP